MGSQNTSIRFTETLTLQGLSASTGSVGDAYDNAVAESLMGLFKNEAIAAGSPFRTGPLRHNRQQGPESGPAAVFSGFVRAVVDLLDAVTADAGGAVAPGSCRSVLRVELTDSAETVDSVVSCDFWHTDVRMTAPDAHIVDPMRQTVGRGESSVLWRKAH